MVDTLLVHCRLLNGAGPSVLRSIFLIVLAHGFLSGTNELAFAQQRVLGIDVSAWQGNLSQTTWNNLHNVNDRDFVFIRSSRGGTTGYYNQSDPNNVYGENTLSQRYDDPYFVQNITRATHAGLFAGPYHFARPDIIASTQNSGGIANTGTDEADHFMEMAGAWMRPGYLLPVLDLEAGQNERTRNALAQFCIDFSDRIHGVMGIRPAIYINGNYANYLQGASSSLQDALVSGFPTLWSARWPNQTDPDSIPVQTGHPKDTYTPIYGPWDDFPNPTHPWSFWQYASTARLSAYNNGNSNIDVDVAQGGIEFLKDHLVPAIWTTDASGQWTTYTNWNSGQVPVAPVQGPGQVPRVGPLTLPSRRLPGIHDTVILDRPNADITVTLATGAHTIRKLEVRETLRITGGSLTIDYVPSADSTPISAQFSAPVTLDGGSLNVHTLQVDPAQTFELAGTLTSDTIYLMPDSTAPGTIALVGDVTFSPLQNASAVIVSGTGTGSSGRIDLGGADRIWTIHNGSAAIDLSIDVPIFNGGLTKRGDGTLELNRGNSYTGDTVVEEGILSLHNPVLHNASDVYLVSDSVLDLNYSGAADTIDSLFIDGISQSAGIWGAIGSGAPYTSPRLTGTGLLQVTTYLAPLPGDFDGNGSVDGSDLSQWLGDFGVHDTSDADGDGDSDGADFLVWQNHFGDTNFARAPSAAVPEPSSAWLAAGIVLAGFLIRCRSRGKQRLASSLASSMR